MSPWGEKISMNKRICLLLFLLFIVVFGSLAAEETLFYEVNARLLVRDRRAAADSISRWSETQGGYFLVKTLERVDFRLPNAAIPLLKETLASMSEELVEYNQNTFDLREQLLSSQSALEAREEILAKNLEYIADSDVEGTLTLEREIRRLMKEIDKYRGILRKRENDSRYAFVSVMLTFKNQSIPDSRPSRFSWINTVDFYDFVNYGAFWKQSGFGGPKIDLPEGFALIDASPEYLAVSPEGVQLRVRKEKNYPKKTIQFWDTALSAHLSERGYIEVGEKTALELGNTPFTTHSWGVSYGNENYLYLTGLRQNGRWIEILEIAGPAAFVKEYF